MYSKSINLCQFVGTHTDILFTPEPQPFWHIQRTGGFRGHIVDTFCNDTGYVLDTSATTYNAIRSRVTKKELCIDCLAEYLLRINKIMPKEEEDGSSE